MNELTWIEDVSDKGDRWLHDQGRMFTFVSHHDLDNLHSSLRIIESRMPEVLSRWYELYRVHFGDRRSLVHAEFTQVFADSAAAAIAALRKRDLRGYHDAIEGIGNQLAARKVPFSEVITALHLYWTSILQIVPGLSDLRAEAYRAFDKLNHTRISVLGNAYVQHLMAGREARTSGLKRAAARPEVDERTRFHGLVGASAPMRELYRRIEAAGRTRGTMLVVGESGTGKELVARAIHGCGPKPNAPFVALNCAALPAHLIESELFGHRRGAFSGANNDYLGLFRAAEGGTLFLDEITEMSAEMQSKLLRAIQERKVRPVGATAEIPVDVRLIGSTNRSPDEAVRSGHMRQDLYYRLQAGVLRIAPLRERIDDIPRLIRHFIAGFNERFPHRAGVVGVEEPAMEKLRKHSWPGNVRELSNLIEGAFTFGDCETIRLSDLALDHALTLSPQAPVANPDPVVVSAAPIVAKPVAGFEAMERDLITRTLEQTRGNKVQAAQLLGISRKRLYSRIGRYGLA